MSLNSGDVDELFDGGCVASLGAGGTVGVGAFKDYGFATYVSHHDVVEIYVGSLASAAYRALETQAGVGAEKRQSVATTRSMPQMSSLPITKAPWAW